MAEAAGAAATPECRNDLSAEEEAAVESLRTRISESKKRGEAVAALYSDFELAQFIIVAKADVEKAYKRFKNFHKLRVTHKFDELHEKEVLQSARVWGSFFGLGGFDKLGRRIICMHGAGMDPSKIDIGICMYAFVQLFKLANPDIASTRRGIVFCANLDGFGWSNFSLQLEKAFSGLYQEGYPVRLGAMLMVDPPWWINALFKIAATFLKKKLMDRIKLVHAGIEDPNDPKSLYSVVQLKELHAIFNGPYTDSVEDTLRKIFASKGQGSQDEAVPAAD